MLSDSKCNEFASLFTENINNFRKEIGTSSSYAEVTQIRPQFQKEVTMSVWRVGRGREPWERSEAGGVIGNERHLHHSPVSSPTEELRKG